MKRTLLTFVLGYAAGWLIIAGFCSLRFELKQGQLAGVRLEDDRLACAAITGGICFLPTAISLAWTLSAARRSGSEQLLAMMGGMGLRMLFTLAASLLVYLSRQGWFEESKERQYAYWGSLLAGYLFSLGWETFLQARQNRSAK